MAFKITAVCFVDALNAPVFLKRFDDGGEDELDPLLILYSALDGFDEGKRRKAYVGLLDFIDEQAVFGLHSNSLVKVLALIDSRKSGFALPSDYAMESFLSSLYNLYVSTICNPFIDVGSALQNSDPARSPMYPELVESLEKRIVEAVASAKLE